MSVDKEQIHKIAHLARLELPDSLLLSYTQDLSHILELVEKINELPCDDVEPLAHPLDTFQSARADQVTETNQRPVLLAGAPMEEAGVFLVPKVIE